MKAWKTFCLSAIFALQALAGCGGGGGPSSAGSPPISNGSEPPVNVDGGGSSGTDSGNDSGAGTSNQAPESILSGSVMGGVSPISGSTVTLYQAGSTTGGSAVSLGTSTTDAHGGFSINFTSPEASSILYLKATGGDAGNGPNAAIHLALMLGSAGNLPSSPLIINEVTTVAFGSTMRFFIQASSDQSLSGTSSGLEKAATTALTLIDPVAGVVQSFLDVNAQNMINGLADILAYCVNGSASDCDILFEEFETGIFNKRLILGWFPRLSFEINSLYHFY